MSKSMWTIKDPMTSPRPEGEAITVDKLVAALDRARNERGPVYEIQEYECHYCPTKFTNGQGLLVSDMWLCMSCADGYYTSRRINKDGPAFSFYWLRNKK